MADESKPTRDFTRLYQATLAPLQRHLTRLLGNHAEAQEIAHDAYLRIYPVTLRQEAEKPEALLYTTARRLAFSRLRRRRASPFTAAESRPDLATSPAPGVVQEVMARQEWLRLQEAIKKLPEGCRSVLLLRKVDLLSHQEIADRLGITVSTVEKQHARALRLLRAMLASPASPAPSTSDAS